MSEDEKEVEKEGKNAIMPSSVDIYTSPVRGFTVIGQIERILALLEPVESHRRLLAILVITPEVSSISTSARVGLVSSIKRDDEKNTFPTGSMAMPSIKPFLRGNSCAIAEAPIPNKLPNPEKAGKVAY